MYALTEEDREKVQESVRRRDRASRNYLIGAVLYAVGGVGFMVGSLAWLLR